MQEYKIQKTASRDEHKTIAITYTDSPKQLICFLIIVFCLSQLAEISCIRNTLFYYEQTISQNCSVLHYIITKLNSI